MSTEFVFAVVDRFEGDAAVVVFDAGASVVLPRSALPPGAAEGAVLRVWLAESGEPDLSVSELDALETSRRVASAESLLKELRKRDPGGDVVM